jgi:DNA methylase
MSSFTRSQGQLGPCPRASQRTSTSAAYVTSRVIGMSVQLALDVFDNPAERRRRRRVSTWGNGEGDGVFGWYHYVQDFTGDFALDWLGRLAKPGSLVWEPFSGSGTTLVAAKTLGFESVGYDLSPFMVDVAATKVDWSLEVRSLERSLAMVVSDLAKGPSQEPPNPVRGDWSEYDALQHRGSLDYPADKKLHRWISPQVLERTSLLINAVSAVDDDLVRRFLKLAAASILIPASNMTFRPNICYETRPTLDYPVLAQFHARAMQMIADYEHVQGTSDARATVSVGDARVDGPTGADLIFTSPPYPNDMEYVHQTRLELALLHYVQDHRGLTRLKKQMISSSVKLVYRENEWQKQLGLETQGVRAVYEPIAKTLEGRNWGWNAADMVAQYFGGMRRVIENWYRRLPSGGQAAVVIGDSAFNGIKVESDRLLAETAELTGMVVEGLEEFRSRWNTKHEVELRETVVLLRRP